MGFEDGLGNMSRMKAINRAAVCQILKAFPKAKTTGFANAVGEYLFRLLDDPNAEWAEGLSVEQRRKELTEMYDDTFPPNVRPDLFEIDETKKLIRLFEIEDTHPLPNEKMQILYEWWWALDCEGLELELFVSDRYGHNLRKLDLAAICFDQKFNLPPNSKLTHDIASEIDITFDQPASTSPQQVNSSPPPTLPRSPQSL